MEAMMVIMGKVAVILILIAVGYAVTKCGWFTERGAAGSPTLGSAGRHGAGAGPRLGAPTVGAGARRVPGGPLLFYLPGG